MQVAVRKNIEQRIVNVRAKIVSTQNQLPLRSHPDLIPFLESFDMMNEKRK
jgi:hypothetical protein